MNFSSSQPKRVSRILYHNCLALLFFVQCDPSSASLELIDQGEEYDQSLELDRGLETDQNSELDLEIEQDQDLTPDLSPPVNPLDDRMGEGIFSEGCPKNGFAHARVLTSPPDIAGASSIAEEGDILLMNGRAAFIIQSTDRPSRTWWYYGGQVIDAVPLEGCNQAAPDRLDSLGIVIGQGQIIALDQAVMRAFSGDRVEIIQDGTEGGAAKVRVYGHDAPMWLVEAELQSQAIKRGRPKLKSESLGIDVWLDYTLAPDEPVIHVELGATNLLGEAQTFRVAILTFFGDEADEQLFAPSQLDFGGISLLTGVPWLSAGGMALSLDSTNMGTAHFAGVDMFIDLPRFIAGVTLSMFMGDEDDTIDARQQRADTQRWSYDLAVHQDGLSSAARALQTAHPAPSPNRAHNVVDLDLFLEPDEDETFEFSEQIERAQLTYGARSPYLSLWVFSPSEGSAQEQFTSLGQLGEHELRDVPRDGQQVTFPLAHLAIDGERYQIRYHAPGSPDLLSPLFSLVQGADALPEEVRTIPLSPRGLVRLTVRDDAGAPIPATLRLTPVIEAEAIEASEYTSNRPSYLFHVIEDEALPVAPGLYRYSLTRGFEYTPLSGEVEILDHGPTELEFSLTHSNPTPRYITFDGHVHAGPSVDSDVSIWRRLRGAAAEGVELVAGTDHEVITDWWSSLKSEQSERLSPWVRTLIAEEATATLPEHMNIYPVPLETTDPRGDPPRWYGLGFDAFTDALHERGAGVIQLNHPRQGCNYLCIIGYDRLTGEPTTDVSIEYFGYDTGELWGWGFNAVELLNGPRALFIDPDRPDESGFFEDWASFINLGHRVTAMGVTDIHGIDKMGTPVSLIELSREGEVNVQDITPDRITESILSGRVQVSLGAWVDLHIAGAGLGEIATAQTVETTEGESIKVVQIQASVLALPEVDVSWVYLFVNCDLVKSWEASHPHETIKLDIDEALELESDAWVSIAAFGETSMPQGLRDYDPRVTPRVITNPIYIDVDQDGSWTPPGGKHCRIPEGREP